MLTVGLPQKIIYCTIKIVTPEELEWYTEDCLALKREFPDLIAGLSKILAVAPIGSQELGLNSSFFSVGRI